MHARVVVMTFCFCVLFRLFLVSSFRMCACLKGWIVCISCSQDVFLRVFSFSGLECFGCLVICFEGLECLHLIREVCVCVCVCVSVCLCVSVSVSVCVCVCVRVRFSL